VADILREIVRMLTWTVYEEYAGSWLFLPENFRAKLEDESYLVQHAHRAHSLKQWIPERHPEYNLDAEKQENVAAWTTCTRQAVRECVFTRFPNVATKYYVKRSQHVEGAEESRLRELITSSIPSGTDGWSDDFALPPIVIKQPTSGEVAGTRARQSAVVYHGELTPPSSPIRQPADLSIEPSQSGISYADLHDIPVCIEALPRQPPYFCKPGPPPRNMSAAARLACLARWTACSASGTPYLRISPHPKDFNLQWRDAIEAGVSAEGLVTWAQGMWWNIWVRQCVVNWRGMWAKRFEKEDAKAEKAKEAEEEKGRKEKIGGEAKIKAEELVRAHKQKIMESSGTA
jgi:hypothetical protein